MARIVIFDSGVGGLSILQALQSYPPLQQQIHQWIFCSDNAFFPYGTKQAPLLVARVLELLRLLEQQYQPDLIVLACNTASTIALEAARAALKTPIVGVVPAIKPAAQVSQSKVIGLLATPATVSRSYTQQLIDQFASDCQVVRLGTSELVSMAEQLLRRRTFDQTELYRVLAPFRQAIHAQQMDTVVLACTHFPLLLEDLIEQLPEIKYWIDSGEAIARRVHNLVMQNNLPSSGEPCGIALFTRIDPTIDELTPALEKLQLSQIQALKMALILPASI